MDKEDIFTLCVVLAVLSVVVFILFPRQENITVNDVDWEYRITVEEYRTVSKHGTRLPIGARLRYTSENLDGDTVYYYDIEEWEYERSVITQGHDRNPYWGTVHLGYNEREGSRKEIYSVICKKDGEEKSYTCSRTIWNTLQEGKSYVVKVSAGNIIEIIE